MNKCNPADMRGNLSVVEAFKISGIDFVAIPVMSPDHKRDMLKYVDKLLAEIADNTK